MAHPDNKYITFVYKRQFFLNNPETYPSKYLGKKKKKKKNCDYKERNIYRLSHVISYYMFFLLQHIDVIFVNVIVFLIIFHFLISENP
ncbi:hypothetical protein Avbf_09171 [Armadillidium vulgare]|nr:hypothetical protein Avbf_09171 [Armadillidium vulgare]